MTKTILKETRSELGKKFRREYEQGSREHGGRTKMNKYVPRDDNKCGTLTMSFKDNMVLEYDAKEIVTYVPPEQMEMDFEAKGTSPCGL